MLNFGLGIASTISMLLFAWLLISLPSKAEDGAHLVAYTVSCATLFGVSLGCVFYIFNGV